MSAIDDALRWAIKRDQIYARQHRAAAEAGLDPEIHMAKAERLEAHAELCAELLVDINARRTVGLYDDEGSPS